MTEASTVRSTRRWLAKIPVRINSLAESGMTGSRQMYGADWTLLALMVAMACVVRLVFYTGAMGSDDVIYTEAAVAILHGDWAASNYVGALRYGIN
ncbi:MAG: hypothetical protein M3Z54_14040, partial [Gemmatimonadota bacterium]|nr:hypothetical protein [Gemmatimonadota bacterium]